MRSNPERLAWRILLGSFITFLIMCSGTIYAIQWLIFQSTREMDIDVGVSRGTVALYQPNSSGAIAVKDRRSGISTGSMVQTDEVSEAVVIYREPVSGDPIASLVIFSDSQVTLTSAEAPRFGLNQRPYQIQVNGSAGRMLILLFEQLPREIMFEVQSPASIVQMQSPGKYSIDILSQQTEIVTYLGNAVAISKSPRQSLALQSGERTAISAEPDDRPLFVEAVDTLLTYDFTGGIDGTWKHYNVGELPSTVRSTIIDGRSALLFDRSQTNWPDLTVSHGEAGLVQLTALDVSDYSSLQIQSTFFIEEQSLSVCGELGSECPIMIRMHYLDAEGTPQELIYGFYAHFDSEAAYPNACASCRRDHERVNLGSWYTFLSGNLIAQYPDLRPAVITEFSVYTSGHAYKVYLSEITLTGSK